MKIDLALLARKELTPADKLLLGYLGHRIGNNGECWPGIETIRKDLGLNRSTVLRHLDRLADKGLIVIVKQGHGRANHYQLVTSNWAQPAPGGKMQPVADCNPDQAQIAPVVGAGCAQNQAQVAPVIERTKKRTNEKNNDEPEGFAEFWELYPRKVGKGAARSKWKIAVTKAPIDTILESLDAQLPTITAKETQYQAHPATWLHQERWADEVDEPNGPTVDWRPPTDEETAQIRADFQALPKEEQEAFKAMLKLHEPKRTGTDHA